jgi:hydrogenase expression/formation protein HypD
MKYISEFRDTKQVKELSNIIHKISKKEISIMEVCGSHTMAIHRFGIKDLLPSNIKLISGPGCPVCVTAIDFIDKAIELAKMEDAIITTFGDLIKVPGSYSTLEKEKAAGADVRIVYSILEAIDLAITHTDKNIVFLAIGFETTTPATAAGIMKTQEMNLKNFTVLCAHKIMPPPMKAIIEEGIKTDGFLAPGHVSVITGIEMYNFIVDKFHKGVVVSGFEPIDILQSILMLVKQLEENKPKVEIQYTRVVKPEGNQKARDLVENVFDFTDASWRGLGTIKQSALKIRTEFEQFDSEKVFNIKIRKPIEPKGCICGQVLKGLNRPSDCKLFGKVCTPENPTGACMVSSEGACNVFFRYGAN